MGWEDRQYAQEGNYYRGGRMRYRGSGMGAYDVVTKIIIANIVVYLFHYGVLFNFFNQWLIMRADAVLHGQVWRLFTATYMHAPGIAHIGINMFVLYMFGPLLERRWGARQFFVAYTLGGVAGNVLLTFAGLVNFIPAAVPALGASGSVMAIMAAGAVYYPTSEVLVYFILPVQLRTVVIIYAAGFVLNVMNKGANYGGDLCHIAGLGVGYWWARTGGFAWARGEKIPKFGAPGPGFARGGRAAKPKDTTFRERVTQRKADAATVDRILAKVSEQGIHSLSAEEKETLRSATERLKTH